MPLIVIDGPEKSGKSTLVEHLRTEYGAVVRGGEPGWLGPADPDDRVFGDQLRIDVKAVRDGTLVVWDRSWASEVVYGTLLGEDRRLGDDWWKAEWLYGRAVQTCGVRVMLLGPDVGTLSSLRTPDDLPVDPHLEREAFREYGQLAGWRVFENPHNYIVRTVANLVRGTARLVNDANQGIRPPHWAGPPYARVVIVGQDRDSQSNAIGAWLPFTSRLTSAFGREFGPAALRCGWTNISDCPPQYLRDRDCVVACGERAHMWVRYYADVFQGQVVEVPHPSWVYRFTSQTLTARAEVEVQVEDVVKEFLT